MNPYALFDALFADAKAENQPEPEAMVLSLVDQGAQPSGRVVLYRGRTSEHAEMGREGFCFYTNYQSAKAQCLESNPKAGLNFFWQKTGHQIRIEGQVKKVSAANSDAYWKSRPRGSQISALASEQSSPLGSYAELVARAKKLEADFQGKEIPRPGHWGGYALYPDRFEIWKSGEFRLHERQQWIWDFQSRSWKHSWLNP